MRSKLFSFFFLFSASLIFSSAAHAACIHENFEIAGGSLIVVKGTCSSPTGQPDIYLTVYSPRGLIYTDQVTSSASTTDYSCGSAERSNNLEATTASPTTPGQPSITNISLLSCHDNFGGESNQFVLKYFDGNTAEDFIFFAKRQ